MREVLLQLIRAKLHHLKVTNKELNYMGSLGVDAELLREVGMYPGERVEVYNVDNGKRFTTYLISEPSGSRRVCLYGAAARTGEVGDRLIVVSYGLLSEDELREHRYKVLILGAHNEPLEVLEERVIPLEKESE